jgi:hypothetical protein
MKSHAYCGLNVKSVNNNEFYEFKGEKSFCDNTRKRHEKIRRRNVGAVYILRVLLK